MLNKRDRKRNLASPKLSVESLEHRFVLSATPGTVELVDGALNICGDEQDNRIIVAIVDQQVFVAADFLQTPQLFDVSDVSSVSVLGGDGNDTVVTTSLTGMSVSIDGELGDDLLFGSPGDDVIMGGIGADRIFGNAGNDEIDGGAGEDFIIGAAGDDEISGGDDDDTLFGVDGTDQLFGNLGADSIFGGSGDDTVLGGEGNDTVLGQLGADTIEGNAGNDSLTGGDGVDRIEGQAGDDSLFGGAGNDTILGGEGSDLVVGDAGDDILDGNDGDDSLLGGADDDTISGGAGNDQLVGGDGNDELNGDAGMDRLFGVAGNDTVDGGADGDELFGGEGDDTLLGGDATDRINGGLGADVAVGGSESDLISGGAGNDLLVGGLGDDVVTGGEGDDVLVGGTTDFDGSLTDLSALRAILTSGAGFADRVAALEAANLINGDPSIAGDGAVNEDGQVDTLNGLTGTDLFFSDGDANDQNGADGEIVANRLPQLINPVADQVAPEAEPFNLSVPADTFSDPDGDSLTLSANVGLRDLQVSVENVAAVDGFSLTPFWVGLHDGSFDLFDVGTASTPGLELIAEEGDASVLVSEFEAAGRVQLSGIGNADGFPGAPVIEPGETAVGVVNVANPAAYPFLSFASMVIPSNDAFVGNGDPLAHRIFNDDGSFAGPLTIQIFGSDIYDSGTEVNDAMGAAFSALGGTATDQGSTVQLHVGLDNFEGTETAAGNTIATGATPEGSQLIAVITIDQVPSLPDWLSFDASTGQFTGTPDASDAGTVEVELTATDPDGLSVTDTFEIEVTANQAPALSNAIADQAATTGNAFDFTLPANTFTDPDADALTFVADVDPSDVQVTIENFAEDDGFGFTPFWVGTHNGSFDLFDVGSTATAGLELIAEEGDASVLVSEFEGPGRIQTSGIGNPAGFAGAPVIEPGEVATGTINTVNPAAYQYFSFASMVIPSNDAFVGNSDPLAHQIFNADGSFIGPMTINVFGSDIYDSGTEVNDEMGAAFSALGGTATDQGGTVQLHEGLSDFEGTDTAAGNTIAVGATPAADELIARIMITEIATLPDWLTFDPTTGQFTGTPEAGDVGTFEVEVTVTDPGGLSATDTFEIVVS